MKIALALFPILIFAQAPTPAPAPAQLHPVAASSSAKVAAARTALVGKKLPPIENLDLTKAPYSLLSFMRSGCQYCSQEMPRLAAIEQSISGQTPTIGILKAQTIQLIKNNKIADAIAVLGDLEKAIDDLTVKPRKVGNLQILPVFAKQDAGSADFLDSGNWIITPALFSAMTQDFAITGTPTTVLVDQTGTVKAAWVGLIPASDYMALRAFVRKQDLGLFSAAAVGAAVQAASPVRN